MSRAVTVHASFPGGAAVASDQGFQDYAMERLGFFGDVTRRATRSACEQSG